MIRIYGVGKDSFQLRAVSTWLKLHQEKVAHVPPIDRPLIKAGPNDKSWEKQNGIDAQLLPLLNRFCFRCHSSLKYHVFDKQMVVDRKDLIASFIRFGPDNIPFMPQDRRLTPETIEKIEA